MTLYDGNQLPESPTSNFQLLVSIVYTLMMAFFMSLGGLAAWATSKRLTRSPEDPVDQGIGQSQHPTEYMSALVQKRNAIVRGLLAFIPAVFSLAHLYTSSLHSSEMYNAGQIFYAALLAYSAMYMGKTLQQLVVDSNRMDTTKAVYESLYMLASAFDRLSLHKPDPTKTTASGIFDEVKAALPPQGGRGGTPAWRSPWVLFNVFFAIAAQDDARIWPMFSAWLSRFQLSNFLVYVPRSDSLLKEMYDLQWFPTFRMAMHKPPAAKPGPHNPSDKPELPDQQHRVSYAYWLFSQDKNIRTITGSMVVKEGVADEVTLAGSRSRKLYYTAEGYMSTLTAHVKSCLEDAVGALDVTFISRNNKRVTLSELSAYLCRAYHPNQALTMAMVCERYMCRHTPAFALLCLPTYTLVPRLLSCWETLNGAGSCPPKSTFKGYWCRLWLAYMHVVLVGVDLLRMHNNKPYFKNTQYKAGFFELLGPAAEGAAAVATPDEQLATSVAAIAAAHEDSHIECSELHDLSDGDLYMLAAYVATLLLRYRLWQEGEIADGSAITRVADAKVYLAHPMLYGDVMVAAGLPRCFYDDYMQQRRELVSSHSSLPAIVEGVECIPTAAWVDQAMSPVRLWVMLVGLAAVVTATIGCSKGVFLSALCGAVQALAAWAVLLNTDRLPRKKLGSDGSGRSRRKTSDSDGCGLDKQPGSGGSSHGCQITPSSDSVAQGVKKKPGGHRHGSSSQGFHSQVPFYLKQFGKWLLDVLLRPLWLIILCAIILCLPGNWIYWSQVSQWLPNAALRLHLSLTWCGQVQICRPGKKIAAALRSLFSPGVGKVDAQVHRAEVQRLSAAERGESASTVSSGSSGSREPQHFSKPPLGPESALTAAAALAAAVAVTATAQQAVQAATQADADLMFDDTYITAMTGTPETGIADWEFAGKAITSAATAARTSVPDHCNSSGTNVPRAEGSQAPTPGWLSESSSILQTVQEVEDAAIRDMAEQWSSGPPTHHIFGGGGRAAVAQTAVLKAANLLYTIRWVAVRLFLHMSKQNISLLHCFEPECRHFYKNRVTPWNVAVKLLTPLFFYMFLFLIVLTVWQENWYVHRGMCLGRCYNSTDCWADQNIGLPNVDNSAGRWVHLWEHPPTGPPVCPGTGAVVREADSCQTCPWMETAFKITVMRPVAFKMSPNGTLCKAEVVVVNMSSKLPPAAGTPIPAVWYGMFAGSNEDNSSQAEHTLTGYTNMSGNAMFTSPASKPFNSSSGHGCNLTVLASEITDFAVHRSSSLHNFVDWGCIDCIGDFIESAPCDALCESHGIVRKAYHISVPGNDCGKRCEHEEGVNTTEDCQNFTLCNCTGIWLESKACDALCESAGSRTMTYHVTKPAMERLVDGKLVPGADCEAKNMQTRDEACFNHAKCTTAVHADVFLRSDQNSAEPSAMHADLIPSAP